MSARLVRSLAAGALVVTGLAATPVVATVLASPAQAAVAPGPTAVAISGDGTTYAGTAAGGSLTRVDATGAVGAPLPLPRSGPVDGLAFAPDGDLWVSYGFGASKISASTGAETAYIEGPSGTSCPATDDDDPGVYGGIVATATEVVIAHRCVDGAALNKYELISDTWQGKGGATPVLGGRFGDLAYGPASGDQSGNAYYLAVPDQAKVEVRTGFDNVHGTPLRTITIEAEGGGVTPRPVGVAVDDAGTVFVADAANHVIYVYFNGGSGANQGYDRYIGNPPDPDTYVGGFDRPSAIAQYPRNGALDSFRGDLFVADSGNSRVQRLNTYGYGYWAAPTDGSPSNPSSAPINRTLPTVVGTPALGRTLTCDPGEWAGAPTSYLYGWNRDGSFLQGEDASTYAVRSGDAGRKISCFVRAVNSAGTSDFATSANVTISQTPPPASAPVNQIAPTISGTPRPGNTLTCANGTWSGSPTPTFSTVWYRDGVLLPGETGASYVVTDADLGSTLLCRVTATNSQGSAGRSSVGVQVTASTPTTGCPGPTGTVSIDAAATYTTSAAVSLRIRPPAGATQVVISNDGGFDSATVRALSADCLYPWALAVGGGTATKVVYVRFAGGGVSETFTATDDIVLDGAAPAIGTPRLSATSRRGVYQVTLAATDKISRVAKVQFATSPSARATTVRYQSRFTTRSPSRFAYARVFDGAGNPSAWKRTVRVG